MQLNDRDRARFWARVDDATTPGDCWPWTGNLNAEGRGRFTAGGTTEYAYRVAWQDVHGEALPGVIVRHLCGNPACCRPDHLAAGDQRSNNLDTVAHGRHRAAKLDRADARQIRERLASPDRPSQRALAAAYGVSPSAISEVVLGKSWPRAGGPIRRRRR